MGLVMESLFLLGHTGISLGVAWAAAGLLEIKYRQAVQIDFRLIILGSILPDFIDKPLGFICWQLCLGNINGRTIAHTLLFLAFLLISGLSFLIYKKNPCIFILAAAYGGHLIFDEMWKYPAVLFWPVYGLSFPPRAASGFLDQIRAWFYTLQVEPRVFIPEIAGGIILLLLFIRMIRNKELMIFWREGKIN